MKFKDFCYFLDKIEGTSGRIEMANLIKEMFFGLSKEEIDKAIYLLQGKLLPEYYGVVLGLGERFAIEAISISSGYSKKEVELLYEKLGDLGKVAEELLEKRRQFSLSRTEMSVREVYDRLYKIAVLAGEGSQTLKIRNLAYLLNNSSPLEGRYIVRIVIGKLRLGVGDATILDALASLKTYDDKEKRKEIREDLERAYSLCSDLGEVAKSFFAGEDIKNFKIKVGKPLLPALAERAVDAEEIYKRLGKCGVEYKYDGFRMQVHKKGEEVLIFSRKLDRIEHMFPDIVESVKKLKQKEIIFEGEALAYNLKEGKFFSFQETMHRRRKYGIEKTKQLYPLKLYVFDLLYLEGEDFTKVPFIERRKALEKIFPLSNLDLSHFKIASSPKEIEEYFKEALEKGLEGIMAKDLKAPYKAGKRGFSWIKLKRGIDRFLDSIDAVIVGYYFGKGARAKFGFGGLLVAVYNEDKDRFETIAKIGSGFTEEEMIKFKKMLDEIKVKEPFKGLLYKEKPDVWVEPKYVVEVVFDEITLSDVHTCFMEENNGKGFALRFPRFYRLREDKDVYDATTSKEVYEIYLKKFKH